MGPLTPGRAIPRSVRLPRRIVPCLPALLALAPAAARAHLGSTKYLTVERTPDGARIEVAVEAVDASMEIGLGPEVDEAALTARSDAIRAWLAEGVAVSGRGGRCAAEASEPVVAIRDDRPFLELVLTYRCPSPAADLVLRDDTVFPDDPQHEAFVHVRWSGETDARVLRRDRRTAPLGEPPSVARLAGTFLWEGALHLATGYDHLLFLLSLVLAAGLVAVREGTRRALADVAALVTSFTIGHSVTLIAAALGIVVLPSQLVESVIAASIIAVAVVNVWRPEARRSMPWLAFFFGLIHGFGFSSVLAEYGLPSGHRVLALLCFNVGIELAQLAFVAVVLGPLAWAARYDSYRNVVVRGGSVVIALLAAVWLAERALGL